jgi:hypothetical protein
MNSKMNTSGYDKRALSIDSPIYEYYAQKILDKTGIKNGICLDAGSGGGYLGLALSRIPALILFSWIYHWRCLKGQSAISKMQASKKGPGPSMPMSTIYRLQANLLISS